MNTYVEQSEFKGMPCVSMSAGGYTALFAPEIGGMMLRLHDDKNNYEILRFDNDFNLKDIKENPIFYGLTTLYLPNRIDAGVLRTHDAIYQLPINEPERNNFIHGFLHFRKYTLTSMKVKGESAIASCEYNYDENDEFYKYLPLKFKSKITFTLSSNGLEQNVEILNLSEKYLPVGMGSHTAIKCPYDKNTNPDDLRIIVGMDKRVVCDKERWLPTEEFAQPDELALKFKNGTMNPLTVEIDNEMFRAHQTIYNERYFNGVRIFDAKTNSTICYETGDEYKFWLVWNQWGNKGFCCPEPMSWMINSPNLKLDSSVTGYTQLKPNESWKGYQHLYTENH